MTYSLVEQTGLNTARRLPLAFAGAAACYLLLLVLGARLLNDPDTFWQIAVGDWIVAHRALPHADVFSSSMAGAPWISTQWLAQVIFAQTFALAGWTGLVALSATAIAGAFGLLIHFLHRTLPAGAALVLALGALVLASPHLVARPHVLALPVMVIWAAGLVRAVDDRRAPSFALLPLMTLWANLHGGFVLGIALIAPLALEALLQNGAAERWRALSRWAVFALLALAASCITPYGPQSLLATARILRLGEALSLIAEWQPQDFSVFGGFELCLMAAAGYALYRGLTLPPIRILLVFGLLHMALAHVRNGEVLGFIGPLLVAAPLAPQIGRRDPAVGNAGAPVRAPVLVVLVMLAAVSYAAAQTMQYMPNPRFAPQAAVAAVKASGKTRILNSYDFGGYLIASGIAPYIDGRTELYGEDFVVRHHRALMLQDLDQFLRLLHDANIDVTLLEAGTPAIGLLDHLPGWKRIYADDVAVVHVRSEASANGGKDVLR
ncbi:MAG TPA: hypothetical protein VFL51_18590 [Pseudolabrys sp.]|nr:hypothetical protein [Pseudolabrys sp.]